MRHHASIARLSSEKLHRVEGGVSEHPGFITASQRGKFSQAIYDQPGRKSGGWPAITGLDLTVAASGVERFQRQDPAEGTHRLDQLCKYSELQCIAESA